MSKRSSAGGERKSGKTQLAIVRKVEPKEGQLARPLREALEMLKKGNSISEAAAGIGVGRATLYRWIKDDPEFQAAYNSWHEEVEESTRSRLMTLYDKATAAVERELDKGNARVAVQMLKGMGVMRRDEPRLTEAEDVKRRVELDRKKRKMEMETEEKGLETAARNAELFGDDFWEMFNGKKKDERTGSESKLEAEMKASGGKLEKVLRKTTKSAGYAMGERPTRDLIELAKVTGALHARAVGGREEIHELKTEERGRGGEGVWGWEGGGRGGDWS